MRRVRQPTNHIAGLVASVTLMLVALPLGAWEASTTLDVNPIERVRAAVEAARERIDIAVYKLEERSVRSALDDALERGVVVRILADAREARTRESEVAWLARRGARVRLWSLGKLHAKLILIDGTLAIQSSANLTESAQHENLELTMVSRVNDDVAAMQRIFDGLWEKAAPRDD